MICAICPNTAIDGRFLCSFHQKMKNRADKAKKKRARERKRAEAAALKAERAAGRVTA